eukprot:scaffold2760_cov167-Amphora_coffeaeformis.AAC.6
MGISLLLLLLFDVDCGCCSTRSKKLEYAISMGGGAARCRDTVRLAPPSNIPTTTSCTIQMRLARFDRL